MSVVPADWVSCRDGNEMLISSGGILVEGRAVVGDRSTTKRTM